MKATLVIFTLFALGVIGISAKYTLAPRLMTFAGGQSFCKSIKQQTVLPRSLRESRALYAFIKTNKNLKESLDTGVRRVWADGRLNPGSNNWKDSEGNVLSRDLVNAYWGPNEPNNYMGHNERCLEIRYLAKNNETHQWNDAPCPRLNNVICEELHSVLV